VLVERVAYGRVAVLLLSNPPFWVDSETGVIVPLVTVTHKLPLELVEHPLWYCIVTPPCEVVPPMAKTAVNNTPVVPGGARNPKGPTIAICTVEGLSVPAQTDPMIRVRPTHSKRVMEPEGMMLPVRSTPYGLSFDVSLELSVMSNPLNEAVLLIITGTRSRVLGEVNGPLNTGGKAGHRVSPTCAMHTVPPDAPATRDGKVWTTVRTARIAIMDASILRLSRTLKLTCTEQSSGWSRVKLCWRSS
jgi:hypothetical protein